jgi:hypothetical protein
MSIKQQLAELESTKQQLLASCFKISVQEPIMLDLKSWEEKACYKQIIHDMYYPITVLFFEYEQDKIDLQKAVNLEYQKELDQEEEYFNNY